MKRFRRIVLPLVLVLILLVMPASAAGSGTLSITADKTTLNEGDVVTITLGVKDNPGIITLAVYAEFDDSVFEVVQNSKSVNGFLDEVIEVNDKAGSVGFDLGNDLATEDVTTSGTVAVFQLRVKKDVYGGDYKVGISFSEAYDKDIKAVTFDAPAVTFTVNGSACDHQLTKTEAVSASCEKAGNKEYFTCSNCHKLFSDQAATQEITQESTVLAALGHAWDNGQVTTQPTCTEKGIKTYTCKNDSTHTKTEDIEALDHDWDEGTIVKTASNSAKGQIEYTCTRTDCGEKKTEEFELIFKPEIEELTDADMKEKLKAAVPEGYSKENTSCIDVVLKVSVDNGANYGDVDDDTMPSEFLIELPYPEGTGSESHDFTVFQVLDDDSVKVIAAEKTVSGLQAVISRMGAFAISYKKIPVLTPTPAPASTPAPVETSVPEQQPAAFSIAPKTGDDGTMDLYFPFVGAVAFIAIVGTCMVIRGKKRI